MLRIAFEDRIADTLAQLRGLARPVLRSAHVGNNGSYNFGWLALAGHTRLGLYEHTAYGVDRVCFPWLVLGDRGRIVAGFDAAGAPRAELAGLHVDDPRVAVPARHRPLLNFGLAAHHDGLPLACWHLRRNARLAAALNRSDTGFDARELLRHGELLARLLGHLAARGALPLALDRWVATRRGRPMVLRIGRFDVLPAPATDPLAGELRIDATDGAALYRGPLAGLLARWQTGLQAVEALLADGAALPPLDYPCPSLVFSYLHGAVVEAAADPEQRRFFHAGGLTSPYYMDRPAFRSRFEALAALLVDGGFLPAGWEFVVIPIGACQFFARPAAAGRLEALLAAAAAALRAAAAPAAVAAALRALGAALEHDPPAARLGLLAGLGPTTHARLRRRLHAFNAADPNRLPVCLRVGVGSPFTRYGAVGLGGDPDAAVGPLVFPPTLGTLSWGEAEWIVQALGELAAERPEAQDPP